MNKEILKQKHPAYLNFMKDLQNFYDMKKQVATQNFENCFEALSTDECLILLKLTKKQKSKFS